VAYDEALADRIRDLLAERRGVVEKRMFGGIAFMNRGYMTVGIVGERLMARIGPARYEAALKEPHVRPMDFTGRPMKGYVFVDPPGIESDRALSRWIDQCVAFVATLPAKPD
jgi:TfoX/Sxy family transcriptional regulator of competence genes